MYLAWNDKRTRQFVTNVGLITSDGPYGPDVMAAEWTHHISYSPCLIALNIRGDDATAHNIKESNEFGVNLASENQSLICSISGKFTGTKVDKIKILKEFGVKFHPAKRIACTMIDESAMQAECKLIRHEEIGDHIFFVGEVIEISADENIRPLLYHQGKYWKIIESIEKPPIEILDRIASLGEKFKK